jgi:pimeloyl-ACP methyl ester carboxylesterase
MPYITVGQENGANIDIYYKDWGSGHLVVFSHGWPLSGDAFEDQMFFLAQHGYRCIAHDRRGHVRSSQPLATKIGSPSSKANSIKTSPRRQSRLVYAHP